MADKFMNIFDVEKGKRLAYFKDYYLIPLIIAIIIIGILVSVIKTVFFFTPADSSMFIATSDKLIDETAIDNLKQTLVENIPDINKDGDVKLDLQPFVVYSAVEDNNSEEMRTLSAKFTAVLTIGKCIVQIVDDASFKYLDNEGLVADYSLLEEYGYINTENKVGKVKIPLSETKLSDVKGFEKYTDSVYITLRSPTRPSDKTEEGAKEFKEQVELFISLIK